MDAGAGISRRYSSLRLAGATLVAVAVAFVALIAGALPASAAQLSLSGTVTCSDGSHVITWTIVNDSSNTVTITSIFTAKDPLSYDVTGYTSPLAPGTTTHGTTVIPGSSTGVVDLYVNETWDESQGSDRASLDLGDPCGTATTTTTSTVVTTTTTVAPTTTTLAKTTTTVAAAGSTVPATVAPATTVAPTAQLPRTGGSGTPGAIAGTATLALGGLALVLGNRKFRNAR